MVPLQDVFGSVPEDDIQDFRADRITGRGRSEARMTSALTISANSTDSSELIWMSGILTSTVG